MPLDAALAGSQTGRKPEMGWSPMPLDAALAGSQTGRKPEMGW